QHVDTTHAGAENGAVDNPFTTIAQAQAAGGDIIYVHSGSTITDSIVLQNGDRLLGEGVNHWISVAGFGKVLLPEANGGGGLRPLIQGTAGDAVTLASNTEFSGFVIDTPTGNGITGVGVSNVSIRNVDVNNA